MAGARSTPRSTIVAARALIALGATLIGARGAAQVRVEFAPLAGAFMSTVPVVSYVGVRQGRAVTYTCRFPGIVALDLPAPPNHGSCPAFAGAVAKQGAAPVLGGRITAWFFGRVGAELSLEYAPSPLADSVTQQAASVVTMSGRLVVTVLPVTARFSPYVAGGWARVAHGGTAYQTLAQGNGGSVMAASWGPVAAVGMRYRVTPTLALRAEAEDYIYSVTYDTGFDAPPRQGDLLFTLGLSIALGAPHESAW